MSLADLAKLGLNRPESGDDVMVSFSLERLDTRGRTVRLAKTMDNILTRHDYPTPVARLLGEAVLLTALVGTSLKFEGRFILQTQTDGPVNMMVVDFNAPAGLRGYARFDADALAAMEKDGEVSSMRLLGSGNLAMTLDQGRHTERYQGIVALDGKGLEEAARHYFDQSEQIPTQVRLAVAQHAKRGSKGSTWRAAGMMVQFFPGGTDAPFIDFPSGKEGEGETDIELTDNKWSEARALFSTLSDGELVDPDVSAERLLYRLFHEKGVRVFDPQPLLARCSCSAERTENMLNESFSAEQRREMAVDGEIEVKCEFCSSAYHFNLNQFVS